MIPSDHFETTPFLFLVICSYLFNTRVYAKSHQGAEEGYNPEPEYGGLILLTIISDTAPMNKNAESAKMSNRALIIWQRTGRIIISRQKWKVMIGGVICSIQLPE